MRDMHDGVGGQLVGLLLAVRRGAVDQTRIAEGLQEVMDEIRLMIDSVDSTATSFGAMLGVFEARVRPRVEDAGFAFGWVHDATNLPDLPPQQVLHLFRLMQEAVTNALKHSRGTRVDVTISNAPDQGLRIVIEDDGQGLDDGASGGHGMDNMRVRTAAIGAQIAFEGAAPGLRIVLQIAERPNVRNAA